MTRPSSPLIASSVLLLAMAGAPRAQAPAASGSTPPAAQAGTPDPAAPSVRHPEAGSLIVRQYPPDTYEGGAQNWGLLQDARGDRTHEKEESRSSAVQALLIPGAVRQGAR